MEYTARVIGRSGKYWAIHIPELGEDAMTQARQLSDVEREAKDYVIVTQDLAPSAVDIRVIVEDFDHAKKVQSRSDRLHKVREQLEQLTQEVQSATDEFVRELDRDGLTLVDIATLAAISRQRAGQILSEPKGVPR